MVTINSKRKQKIIPFKSTNSRHNIVTSSPEEEIMNSRTENSLKPKQDNPIPKIPTKMQSNISGTSYLLNSIKRSIFVQGNEEGNNSAQYSSNVLLTSPHVSQGLKNKYSQIYFETMNQINSNEQKNLISNIYTTTPVNNTITKKREEIMSLLKDYKSNRTCLTSMTNSPTNRSKNQPKCFKEIHKVKDICSIESNLNRNNARVNIPIHYPVCLTTKNKNDGVLSQLNTLKNKGKSNSIKISKAQTKFEKMLINAHKPITFTSNLLKKTQRKIVEKTQIKTDKEETDYFLEVLTIKNTNNS